MKVSLKYKSSYIKADTKNRVNVYSVVGSPESIEQYVADKVDENGKCPMISDADGNDTDVPRYSTSRVLGGSSTLERSTKGQWFVPADEASLLESAMKNETNPAVQSALAGAYVGEVLAKIRAQVQASKSTSTEDAPVVPTKVPADPFIDKDESEN